MKNTSAPSAGTTGERKGIAPTLIERRRAYEETHPDVYFKTPGLSESDEWEAWREGKGDTDDEKLGAHTSLGALLDNLEAQDH